jgi:hypothetical protein
LYNLVSIEYHQQLTGDVWTGRGWRTYSATMSQPDMRGLDTA